MKKYQEPKFAIASFSVQEVLGTSSEGTVNDPYDNLDWLYDGRMI